MRPQLDDGTDGIIPLPVPYGAIALAAFLTAFGIMCFVLAWLHWTQAILGKQRAVRGAQCASVASGSGARMWDAAHLRPPATGALACVCLHRRLPSCCWAR